jgi:Xaa-Pro aminopeptidase
MNTIIYSGKTNHIDPNFIYITECDIPHVTLLTINGKRYMYIKGSHDSQDALQCFQSQKLSRSELISMINQTNDVFFSLANLPTHPEWSAMKHAAINTTQLPSQIKQKRLIKDKHEIKLIRQACLHTCNAMKYMIQQCKPGMTQVQLSTLFMDYLQTKQIYDVSFPNIVAHGSDCKTLHHKPKQKKITSGSLVLVDVGCKYKHYCSDLSRCFPISGSFTKEQSTMYDVLLRTFNHGLSMIQPGASFQDITKSTLLTLFDECVQIQLLNPTDNESDKLHIMNQCMPHSLGHHLGLETHDCELPIEILEPNMIITLEPGFYFNSIHHPLINQSVWNQYKSIGGLRIEDTLLITEQGCKNLTPITKKKETLLSWIG